MRAREVRLQHFHLRLLPSDASNATAGGLSTSAMTTLLRDLHCTHCPITDGVFAAESFPAERHDGSVGSPSSPFAMQYSPTKYTLA